MYKHISLTNYYIIYYTFFYKTLYHYMIYYYMVNDMIRYNVHYKIP